MDEVARLAADDLAIFNGAAGWTVVELREP